MFPLHEKSEFFENFNFFKIFKTKVNWQSEVCSGLQFKLSDGFFVFLRPEIGPNQSQSRPRPAFDV